MKVLVRAPSQAFRRALSEHPERASIDAARALEQHRAFTLALADAGADLVELPPEPEQPDATFVSDTVLALASPGSESGPTELLVVCRPGAESRRTEVESVAACARRLAPGAEAVHIEEPATLEGGDVIVLGDRIAIGLSARTNEEGAGTLADAAERIGYTPFLCPVEDRLHLATAVTAIGSRRLIGTAAGLASLDAAGAAPTEEIERVVIHDDELPAANVLALGGSCFVAAGNPRAVSALGAVGESVIEVDLGEFTKADGGPTCLVALIP